LRRNMNVSNGRTPKYTKSGHRLDVVTAFLYEKIPAFLLTSPRVSLEVKSELESQYIDLLFGLRDKTTGQIMCIFIHNFLSIMRRMETFQEDLVNDVRRGRIKEDLNIPETVRSQLNACLTPMPERAAEIENEFAKGFKGILPRLWPGLAGVSAVWSGGSNLGYYNQAKEMTGPEVPITSIIYTSSEGLMGMAVDVDSSWRGTPRYALLPDTMFYEFLPISNDRVPDLEEINSKDLLLPHELKVNQEYEIIITNASGFYRFRIGDIIRVVDFYQQAPVIEFLYRSGQNLNVSGEKLSEKVFFRALRAAADRWPSTLRDYTVAGSQCAPSRSGTLSPHYLLFVEVQGETLTDEHKGLVDTVLQQQDEEYASFRTLGRIAEMEVHQVPAGTFYRFRSHLLETTTVSTSQFKVPRVLKSRDRVEWFLNNV